MKRSAPELFCYSVAAVLIVTALAKLVSAAGHAGVLNLADPLLILKNRHVMILVGSLEVLIAAVLLFARPLRLKLIAIAWLATSFCCYRIAILMMDIPKPCSCLGTVVDNLSLPANVLDWGLKTTLAYLLIGSYFFLLRTRPHLVLEQMDVASSQG